MWSGYRPVLLVALLVATSCLHYGNRPTHYDQQTQIKELVKQQTTFEEQINKMLSNLTAIEEQVSKAGSTKDKVLIMESALKSERDEVFELQQMLAPPFNLSQTACQEMTNEQKINLLEQVYAARQQLELLKNITITIQPCDRLYYISHDIQKEETILESIEATIFTKCQKSIVLNATVFQSNIYAPNWVLGNQTIDQVIEEYYQRSVQYDSVTNCPIEYPFFNGKACINCPKKEQVFNLQTKKCILCPEDTVLDSDAKVCKQLPHYSAYPETDDWSVDGLEVGKSLFDENILISRAETAKKASDGLPCSKDQPYFFDDTCTVCKEGLYWSKEDDSCLSCWDGSNYKYDIIDCTMPTMKVADEVKDIQKTLCPPSKPYFNTKCISCDSGTYWSVAQKKCLNCPSGQVFQKNDRKCVQPKIGSSYLTLLEDTNWVSSSGNYTKVLEERSEVLKNATHSGECSQDTPYWDGVECVSCPHQFDLSTLKCVTPPKGSVYSPNMHSYVPLQEQKMQTNFNAGKVIASSRPANSSLPTCNATYPYYNGKACIACFEPFPLFDVDTKTCVACDPEQIYNASSLKCEKRGYLYISTNFDKLMATPNTTVAQYRAELLSRVKNNGELIVSKCQNNNQYSNFSQCFSCQDTEYFNIETKTCQSCNGTVNATSRLCIHRKTFLTNLNNTKYLVVEGNGTLEDIAKRQESVTGPVAYCPADQPFAVAGKKCTSCKEPLVCFDLTNMTCSICHRATNLSAVNATGRIIEDDNHTIAKLSAKNNQSKTEHTMCPQESPLYLRASKECISCPNGTYYDLRTMTCYHPHNVTNVAALKNLTTYIEGHNLTLAKLNETIKNDSLPHVMCPADKPVVQNKQCTSCKQPFLCFDLSTMTCGHCHQATNLSAVKTTGRFIEDQNHTIAKINAQRNKTKTYHTMCPEATPLYIRAAKQCVTCPNGTYYDLRSMTCYHPQNVTNVDALKNLTTYIEGKNLTLQQFNDSIKNDPLPHVQCPADKPVVQNNSCTSCQPTQCFDLANMTCGHCHQATSLSAVKATGRFIQDENHTIAKISAQHNKTKTFHTICPQEAPLYLRASKECISCPNGTYYDLRSMTCYHPKNVTNVDALKNLTTYIEGKNFTLEQLNDTINNDSLPHVQCPAGKPVVEGNECTSCKEPLLCFDLSNMTCGFCHQATNLSAVKATGKFIQDENHTIAKISDQHSKSKTYHTLCPQETPLYLRASRECITCPNGTYYDLRDMTCYHPKNVTNVAALQNLTTYVESKNLTLQQFNETIVNSPLPHLTCPADKPIIVEGRCSSCQENQMCFDLASQTCGQCPFTSRLSQVRATGRFIDSGNHTDVESGSSSGSSGSYPSGSSSGSPSSPSRSKGYHRQCPEEKPLYLESSKKCVSCPNGTYYDLRTLTCYHPKNVTNVAALKKITAYVEGKDLTLEKLNETINNDPLPHQLCPESAPMLFDNNCVACHNDTYYLIADGTCYVPSKSTNFKALKASGKAYQQDNHNLEQLESKYKLTLYPARLTSKRKPVQLCPDDQPLYDGSKCIACSNGTYYDLKNLSCINQSLVPDAAKVSQNTGHTGNKTNVTNASGSGNQSNTTNATNPKNATNVTNATQGANGTEPNNATNATNATGAANGTNQTDKANGTNVTSPANGTNTTANNTNQTSPNNQTNATGNNTNQTGPSNKTNATGGANATNNTNATSPNNKTSNQSNPESGKNNKTNVTNPTQKPKQKPEYYPNLKSQNWTGSDPQIYDRVVKLTQSQKNKANAKQCPADKEFYNSATKECQSCPQGTNFNYDTNKCESCPTGKTLNTNTHICEQPAKEGSFSTSMDSDNLIYGGVSSAQLDDEQKVAAGKYPNMQKCPQDKPYFDGYNCLQCRDSTPYFNVVTKKCVACPSSAKYDSKLHECVSQSGEVSISTDPSKMFSSIF